MIRRAWGAAAVLVALLLGARSAGTQPAELPATVVTLTGKTEIYKKGDTKWGTPELRDEVREGDGVRTSPAARTTLRTGGGHSIRLAALTQVFIVPSAGTGSDPQLVRLRLDRGWLWIAVTPGGHPRGPVEVIAGAARVSVRDGGVGFRLNRDGSVLVRTYHGLAVIRGTSPAGQWERNLPDQQELLVPAEGPPPENRKLTMEEGEGLWVLWNEEQDYVMYGGKAPVR
jgi:FecR-like protein